MDSFTVISYAIPAVVEAAPDNLIIPTNEERGGSGGYAYCTIA